MKLEPLKIIKNRKSGVDKKTEAIRKARSSKYGDPQENMAIYRDMVNAFLRYKLKEPLTSREATIVGGLLMKLSRDAYMPQEDNILDGINWLKIAGESK